MKSSNVHPGKVLREKYLEPLGLTASGLASAIQVPANRVTRIVTGTRGISADTALRLAKFLNTTAVFWLNLQQSHDVYVAENSKRTRSALKSIKPFKKAKRA